MRREIHKMITEPVYLENIHSSGRCKGRYGNKNIYLDYGIPGETVNCSIVRQKQGFYSGKVMAQVIPSPHRVNPFCNVEFITGDILKTFRPEFLIQHGKPDLIVLDPPRSGTLIEIKRTINVSGAKKLLYLSCNPVSLAFDLKQLTEVYKVCLIQPFDMLPHTHHLETLVLLERN